MGDGASPAATNAGVGRRRDGGMGLQPAASAGGGINLSAYSGQGSMNPPSPMPQTGTPPVGSQDQRQTRQVTPPLTPPANAAPTPTTPLATKPKPPQRAGTGGTGRPPTPSTPSSGWTPPAQAAPKNVPNPWSETDGQGNPSGTGKFKGEEWVRDGSWWVKKSIVDQNPGILSTPKGENPANDAIVEKNRVSYSDGVTTMVSEQRSQAQGAPAGTVNENYQYEQSIPPTLLARRKELSSQLSRNFKNDSSPKGVLAEEVYRGHYNELPGTGLFFSYHGGAKPWTFKDGNGNEVVGDPASIAAAQKAQNSLNYQMKSGGTGGGAPPPLLAHGGIIKKTPGGKHVSVNGQRTIIGEGSEDEAVMPLSVLSSVVEAAAARGAGRQVSPSAPLLSSHAGAGQKVPKLASGALVNRNRTFVGSGEPTPGGGIPGGFGDSGGSGGGVGIGSDFKGGGKGQGFQLGAWDTPEYTPYQAKGMSPEEQAQLQAITKIAQQLSGRGEATYNIGSGAYADAVKYFQTLTKGNRGQMMAAVAPSAELIREQAEGAKGAALAGQGRSGLRDLAVSGIDRQAQGDIARLTAGVQPGAASSLGALGGQGIQQGNEATEASGALSSAAQQALTQSRQYEEGLGENSRQFGAELGETSRQFGASLAENSRQFELNLAELKRSNQVNEQQADSMMAMQQQMMSQNFNMAMQQFQESIRQFNQGLAGQKSASKGQAIGAGIATVATIAVLI